MSEMKKFIMALAYIVLIVTIASISSIAAVGGSAYSLFMDGKEIESDAAPYMVNNRLLAPVRTISEATGAYVDWNGKAATIYRGEDRLILTVGSDTALYNDIKFQMDVAPVINNGRIFLPLRFISEWLGLEVNFDNDTVRMYKLLASQTPDTMEAVKSNSNGNLQSQAQLIVWQDRMYFRGSYSANIICTDLATGETSIVAPRGDYLQVWGDNLYLSHLGGTMHNRFVKTGVGGNPAQTVLEGAMYCQIQDGWIYYSKTDEKSFKSALYRRLLSGGDEQPLAAYTSLIVITDQHIFVYSRDDGVLLRMNLDGSDKRRLLVMTDITALEYAEGNLYFGQGSEFKPTGCIYKMNVDGAGLQVFREECAYNINYHDGWLYYSSRTTRDYEGNVPCWFPKVIRRIHPDGSDLETLAETTDAYRAFSNLLVLSDGSVYYNDNLDDSWSKIG